MHPARAASRRAVTADRMAVAAPSATRAGHAHARRGPCGGAPRRGVVSCLDDRKPARGQRRSRTDPPLSPRLPLQDPTWPARFAGHDWPKTPKAARELQEALRARIVCRDDTGPIATVCGIDVHYAPKQGLTWAAAALLEFQSLRLELSALASARTDFPYVPGLLSFRETPAVLRALALLSPVPDLLMVDGHGYAHPRRFGIACHIGLLTGLPTIGVAKSRLVGSHAEPGPEAGDRVPLVDADEVIGMVVRTRRGAKPVYVSIGHRVSLERAVELTLAACGAYRLPEPVRLADALSRCHPA